MIRLAALLALALVLLSERGEAQSLGLTCIAVENPALMDEPGAMLSPSAATRLMLAVSKETHSVPIVVVGARVFLRDPAMVTVLWRRGDMVCFAYYDHAAFGRAFRLVFGIDA